MRNIIILSIAAILLFTYCKNNVPSVPKIQTQDSLQIVNDTISILDFNCLGWNPPGLDTFRATFQKQYILKNQIDYDTLILYFCSVLQPNCPNFDFTNHFLVGFRIFNGDSNTTIVKTLFKDSLNKKYIYKLNITSNYSQWIHGIPYCRTMNWLSVPSFPNDWSFEFDTTQVFTQ